MGVERITSVSKIIDLEEYKLQKEQAELAVYLQEVRNMVCRERQGKLLVALHYFLKDEREYGLLSEEQIIEIVNAFAVQVKDGITLS